MQGFAAWNPIRCLSALAPFILPSSMATRHITLVGTHAAGKSTTGNLLVADDRDGPFKVGKLDCAQTTEVTPRPMKHPLHEWVVWDTPGLGDVPRQEEVTSADFLPLDEPSTLHTAAHHVYVQLLNTKVSVLVLQYCGWGVSS